MEKGMRHIELDYIDVLQQIFDEGVDVIDRTGVGTRMVTNVMIEHSDVSKAFPAMMTKKLQWKSVVGELLWFLEGSTDDARLAEITYGDRDKRTIWTDNALADYWKNNPNNNQQLSNNRPLGRVYGKQWRDWMGSEHGQGIDQIKQLINGINTDPFGRRHVVTGWNPADVQRCALPPCHLMFIVNIVEDRLDLLMIQRSADMFLGVPFNIASYGLLMHILGQQTGYKPGKLSIAIANAHIYNNHFDQAEQIIFRGLTTPEISRVFAKYSGLLHDDDHVNLPQLLINTTPKDISEFTVDDFSLINYNPLSAISAPMAV